MNKAGRHYVKLNNPSTEDKIHMISLICELEVEKQLERKSGLLQIQSRDVQCSCRGER